MTPGTPAPAPAPRSPLWETLTRDATVRLLLGWAGVGAMTLAAPLLTAPLPMVAMLLVLAVIVAVIVVAAGGVVRHAEALARLLGDPYGTLVLTLSIVVIEVVLIAAVMLGPGDHAVIAQDSVMAVSMIIMNLVLGLCLLVGGLCHGDMALNRLGTSAYLVMLVALAALAFALPATLEGGGYSPLQALVIAVLTVGLYALFLGRQMGAQASDFQEVRPADATGWTVGPDDGVRTVGGDRTPRAAPPVASDRLPEDPAASGRPLREVLTAHRTELLARTGLLLATMLPIVLLSHHMAGLLDQTLDRLGAPAALGGMLIAMIVFTPESITAVRAALAGEIQRVVNLCHGALVSTFALTIPTVLVIGLLTGTAVVLAPSAALLVLLGATLAVAAISAAAPRVTAMHGGVHLLLFAVYALMLLS